MICRHSVFVDNGGIYLDTDIIALKSLDPLRKYRTTLASADDGVISNGVILTEPHSPFLCMWLHNYHTYNRGIWGGNSVTAGYKLFQTFPDLIHREPKDSFYNPGYKNRMEMFTKHLDLSNNYLIHIFQNREKLPKEISEIDRMDNTLGDVLKFVYNGKV